MSKVWFITGTSRGFGRIWTAAALERGDKVAATARDLSTLDDLVDKYGDAILPIKLDVSDRAADFAAVRQAHEHFGRIDYVVNNAGYTQGGYVEELTEPQARAVMDTNFFGMLWVTQAALPILREQGSGHIVMLSSIAGVYASAGFGMYSATKWALEGLTQALAQEVTPLGIRVTLIEPSMFATDAPGSSMRMADEIPGYESVRAEIESKRTWNAYSPGDPEATAEALFTIVESDDPPLRCFFGVAGLGVVTAQFEERLASWQKWNDLAIAAHGGTTA